MTKIWEYFRILQYLSGEASAAPSACPRPPRAVFRVEKVAAEARLKLLGVSTVGEAEDGVVDVVTAERVAARTEGEPFTEAADSDEVRGARGCRQRDLD
jgi:hypothetical protein